jgi:hypothetical protein
MVTINQAQQTGTALLSKAVNCWAKAEFGVLEMGMLGGQERWVKG